MFISSAIRIETSFNANYGWRQFAKEFYHLVSPFSLQYHLAVTIRAVRLEYFFCQIKANALNIHSGLLFLFTVDKNLGLAPFDAAGGAHTINF